jgi:hypothetical protein
MADDHPIPPYPFMFDPSQFSNKFSNYQGQALPWPSQYSGVPTDALGRPIQSYLAAQTAAAAPQQAPPVTLNSTPQSSPFANVQIPQGQNTALAEPFGGLDRSQWNALTPQQRGPAQAAMQNYQAGIAAAPSDPFVASHNNPSGFNPQSAGAGAMTAAGINGWNQMLSQPQAAAPPAAPAGPDMSQAYLAALSNPGKVATPGATVAQSPPPSGQSGVLQQFLANWKGGGGQTQGAGNYNNQGFLNALQGQV